MNEERNLYIPINKLRLKNRSIGVFQDHQRWLRRQKREQARQCNNINSNNVPLLRRQNAFGGSD